MKLAKIKIICGLYLCLIMTSAFSISALAQMSQEGLDRWLLNASVSGDSSSIQALLRAGANITVTDAEGCTLLMNAIGYPQCLLDEEEDDQYYPSVIDILIEEGVEFSSQEQIDYFLLRAAKFNDVRHARYALSRGADINFRSSSLITSRWTPLMFFSQHCNLEMVRTLILNGALLNFMVEVGEEGIRQTALDIAKTSCRSRDVSRILQDAGVVFARDINPAY